MVELFSKRYPKRNICFNYQTGLEKERNVALYARVSTSKQKKDLENQIEALKLYALGKGHVLNPDYIFSDIASGMNENRRGLNKLLECIHNGKISEVIITHKDRLTRFGFGYFELFFNLFGCKITEINYTEEKTFQEELSEDLALAIHHFSMKFYGKRKNEMKKLEENINRIKEIN